MTYDKVAEGMTLCKAHISFYETLKAEHDALGPEWPMERIDRELARQREWLAGFQESGCDLA